MRLVSLHPLQDRKCLHSSVKLCSKLVGLPAHQLSTMYTQQACALAGHVLTHCTCALLQAPQLLPSGHRFLRPACQTHRRRATFAPKALSPSKFSGVTWTRALPQWRWACCFLQYHLLLCNNTNSWLVCLRDTWTLAPFSHPQQRGHCYWQQACLSTSSAHTHTLKKKNSFNF